MTQIHVLYSGTVQGVGFRYNVQRLARSLSLTGWVKNLPDGNVEMTAQGEKPALEELLARIDQRFDGYIRGQKITFQEAQETFGGFEINF